MRLREHMSNTRRLCHLHRSIFASVSVSVSLCVCLSLSLSLYVSLSPVPLSFSPLRSTGDLQLLQQDDMLVYKIVDSKYRGLIPEDMLVLQKIKDVRCSHNTHRVTTPCHNTIL